MADESGNLIGVGLYTPAEAERLIQVPAAKLRRWLQGHAVQGKNYQPLWKPQIVLGDDKVYLGFRDLLEARVASCFIKRGLSPQKVRLAIELAAEMVGDRPLSTTWLKTDGRRVFLQVAQETGSEPQIIDLFTRQFAFNRVVQESLQNVEFEGPNPQTWWPLGTKSGVLIDPRRSFGQPIEEETSVPAAVLARAAAAEGSEAAAARAWCVPTRAVRRAIGFERAMDQKKAA